jgi:hypothetical protein
MQICSLKASLEASEDTEHIKYRRKKRTSCEFVKSQNYLLSKPEKFAELGLDPPKSKIDKVATFQGGHCHNHLSLNVPSLFSAKSENVRKTETFLFFVSKHVFFVVALKRVSRRIPKRQIRIFFSNRLLFLGRDDDIFERETKSKAVRVKPQSRQITPKSRGFRH